VPILKKNFKGSTLEVLNLGYDESVPEHNIRLS